LPSTPPNPIPAPLLRAAQFVFLTRRRIATVLAIVCALSLGYHVIFGQNGLTAYQQKRAEDKELTQQIQQMQLENGRLKAHTDRLAGDKDAIEHEAREKLHYARPGEVIYTLDDKPQDKSKADPHADPHSN
jgi:cell division protein FtsB